MAFPPVGPGGPNPVHLPPIPSGAGSKNTSSSLSANPGLLTSTGGLYGLNGVLLSPVYNTVTNKSFILSMDPTNFNCEENCEYDFPQEIPPRNAPQEGRDVNCHLVILKYREIGYASLTLNITTFQKNTDSFNTYSYPVSIPPIPLTSKARKQSFPDNRIHTLRIPIDVPGERPQITVTSNGSAGGYSIISIVLCGNADETPQV